MKNKYLFFLTGIFFLALFFRIYNLSNLPYGFHFDEVKAGWNAYSILKTGADDKGNQMPLYYDSFGDFRPAGIIYSIIPAIAIFGKTIFAVRLPSALIGALTVIPLYLILNLLFSNKSKSIGLIGAVLLALNPWHIMISRATSESIIAIFLALFGIYFLFRTIKYNRWSDLVLSGVFWIPSYFFYHNVKILAPVLIAAIILTDVLFLKLGKKYFKPVILGIFLIITTLVMMGSKESKGRLSQVSLISDFQVSYEIQKMPNEEGQNHVFIARVFHNRLASYIRRFAEEYKNYLGTNFLLGDNGARPIRYNVPYVGLITYLELMFLILGITVVWTHKEVGLFLILLALAPIPAAVTNEDTPNLQRASFMIPFLILIESYGVLLLFKAKKWVKLISGILITAYILNFVYFWHMYNTHQKYGLATYYRDGGNVELALKLDRIKSNYDQIIISGYPDNLSTWLNFFGERTSNMVFTAERCPSSNAFFNNRDKDILVVDAEGCLLSEKLKLDKTIILKEIIKRPDNSPPYYLWERAKKAKVIEGPFYHLGI